MNIGQLDQVSPARVFGLGVSKFVESNIVPLLRNKPDSLALLRAMARICAQTAELRERELLTSERGRRELENLRAESLKIISSVMPRRARRCRAWR
jgi:hypothetical protein